MNEIEVKNMPEYDVIVVGGGIAGVAAAVSATRCGAEVLLLEKQFNLGGLATGGLISWYEPLCDGHDTQVVSGIAEELIKLSVRYSFDSLPEKWGGTDRSFSRKDRYATYYSPTVFSLLLDEYIKENGVNILFDTYATYPVMDGNTIKGVICENTDGRSYFEAGAVIDATGDATVMSRAGVPCKTGKNYMSYIAHMIDDEIIDEYKKTGKTWALRAWRNAGSDMLGNGHPDGMPLAENLTAKELTDYMITGKLRMLEKIKKRDRYSYDIMSIPTMPQLRVIRHIKGDENFNAIEEECFESSLGRVTDFRITHLGKTYQMPEGALYNSNFKGLYAAGRIISSPTFDGWEVARVIPTCAFTGEAAGRLAAEYAKKS